MKKIPSLFLRDEHRSLTKTINPDCVWVCKGEGVPTRKWDGTACRAEDGKFYKRYDAKKGVVPPNNFLPCQDPDPITGHWPGWIPVDNSSTDRWFREGFDNYPKPIPDWTYELCGPKVNGNPEGFTMHVLIPHGRCVLENIPTTFDELYNFFMNIRTDIEGIVWWHPDGRMAKIKARDFGLKRRRVEGIEE